MVPVSKIQNPIAIRELENSFSYLLHDISDPWFSEPIKGMSDSDPEWEHRLTCSLHKPIIILDICRGSRLPFVFSVVAVHDDLKRANVIHNLKHVTTRRLGKIEL